VFEFQSKITPFEPDCEKINLKHVGRFAGQGKEFYSVARHSVHVSLEVEARGGSREAGSRRETSD
jgi:hypothetical protein